MRWFFFSASIFGELEAFLDRVDFHYSELKCLICDESRRFEARWHGEINLVSVWSTWSLWIRLDYLWVEVESYKLKSFMASCCFFYWAHWYLTISSTKTCRDRSCSSMKLKDIEDQHYIFYFCEVENERFLSINSPIFFDRLSEQWSRRTAEFMYLVSFGVFQCLSDFLTRVRAVGILSTYSPLSFSFKCVQIHSRTVCLPIKKCTQHKSRKNTMRTNIEPI